jgi:hypothetical protein
MAEIIHQLEVSYQLPILNEMLIKASLFLSSLFLFLEANCQEKSKVNFPLLKQENIEFQALKPTFFLLSQEYIIFSKEGKPKYRYGKNYFGRSFAVGVLTQDHKIWFPKYVRYPWVNDPNFKEYKETHFPKLSGLRYRLIEDTVYRDIINIENPIVDTNKVEMFIIIKDSTTVRYSENSVNQGPLFIFYTSNLAPENKGDISHLIISVNDLEWDSDGIGQVEDPLIGNQRILGGAFYQRIITSGKI